MEFLEKNLEDIIYEADNLDLMDRSLYLHGKKYRQVRIGNYGIADIISISRDIDIEGTNEPYLAISVVELKQKIIDAGTLLQATRYCKGIESYISRFRKKKLQLHFKIILIGKELKRGDFCYLPDFITNVHLYTYDYRFDGIYFKKHNRYVLTNEGF